MSTARKQQRFYCLQREPAGDHGDNNNHEEVYLLTEEEGDMSSERTYVLQLSEDGKDDELTSLSWLQKDNLLQNINLGSSAAEPVIIKKPVTTKLAPEEIVLLREDVEISSWEDGSNLSYASDVAQQSTQNIQCDESGIEVADLSSSSSSVATPPSSSAASGNNSIHNNKPPHSFSALIFLAIESSPSKALPVRDIYAWITKNFPYYRHAPVGWKNSVRHNLSLNKCFYKVECGLNMTKGSFWMVDPAHRPQLIQSLCKVSYIKADFIHQLINETAPAGGPNKMGTIRPLAPPTPSTTSRPAATVKILPKEETIKVARKILPTSPCPSSSSSTTARSNMPDPKLFPFLSRRLASTARNFHGDQDHQVVALAANSPDVDAATAMLSLCQSRPVTYQTTTNGRANGNGTTVSGHSHSSAPVSDDEDEATISSSPTDDHTYSFNSPRPVLTASSSRQQRHSTAHPAPSGKRTYEQHEIAHQVPDMVRELEVCSTVQSDQTVRPNNSKVRGRGCRSRGKRRR